MSHPFGWPIEPDVGRLVADAQERGAEAIEPLLTALRPALLHFFTRRVSGDMAEDLTQEALIRILRTFHLIEPTRADRLITTIAVNLFRTAYAKLAREQRRTVDYDVADHPDPSGWATIEGALQYDELARAVHRVCEDELPRTLQEPVFGLLQGESQAEIAHRLRISPITVRTRLFRARPVLRRALRAHLVHEPETAWANGAGGCMAVRARDRSREQRP